jgi:hypothetical protein
MGRVLRIDKQQFYTPPISLTEVGAIAGALSSFHPGIGKKEEGVHPNLVVH